MIGSDNEREALAAELERHVEEEDEILAEYRSLSDKLSDGALSILVDHIVTEEEMHHFLLRTMAEWLRTPPTPEEKLGDRGLDREKILQQTQRLQDHEQKTIESCRALRDRISAGEGEIFHTLLEAIALDSEKHHRLLSTLEKLLP